MRRVVEMRVGETAYKLLYNINTLCDIEEASGKSFPKFAAELSDPEKLSLRSVRIMLWAGLQAHQPGITIEDAGDIIATAGGILPVFEKVSEALESTNRNEEKAGKERQASEVSA